MPIFAKVKSVVPDRYFAFLERPGQKDLFCYYGDAFQVNRNGDEPKFDRGQRMSKFRVTLEIGDEVAYELGEDSDGRPKAFPWIYKSHWDKAAEHIASRPVYRVRDSRGDAAGNMNEPTTLWEGTNLDDAFNRYRIPSFRHINGLPFHDSDDIFSHRQWFEKKGQDDPDDEWEECSNPFPSWEQSR